jgi:hypothetical protein
MGFNMWLRVLKIEIRIASVVLIISAVYYILFRTNMFFSPYFLSIYPYFLYKQMTFMCWDNLNDLETLDWDWIESVSEEVEEFFFPFAKVAIVVIGLVFCIAYFPYYLV